MQKFKTPATIFFHKNDATLETNLLKLYVRKNLIAAGNQSGATVQAREKRQYFVGQACRYELELLRRGVVGDIPVDANLTEEQQDDMLAFFYRFGGGDPNLTLLPSEESDQASPVELEENIYHYECGCIYNLTTKVWKHNCPLFADGRCPQASPKKLGRDRCACIWPTHCTRCQDDYYTWWKNAVAADVIMGPERGAGPTTLINESGRLNTDDAEDKGRMEDEGGALAESDRRVLARAAGEAQAGGHYFIG